MSEKLIRNTLIAEKEKALGEVRIRADQALRDSEQNLLECANRAKHQEKRMVHERDAIINKMNSIENELGNLRLEKQNLTNLVAIEKARADDAECNTMKLQDELKTCSEDVEKLTTRLHESRNEINRVQSSLTASYNKQLADLKNECSALKLELHAYHCKAKEYYLLRESRLAQERVQLEAEDAWSVACGIAEKKSMVEHNLEQARQAAVMNAKATATKASQDAKMFSDTLAKLETEHEAVLFQAHKAMSETEEKQQYMLVKEKQKYLAVSTELSEAQATITRLHKDTNGTLIAAGLKAYKLSRALKETSESLLTETEKTKELNGLLEAATASIDA